MVIKEAVSNPRGGRKTVTRYYDHASIIFSYLLISNGAILAILAILASGKHGRANIGKPI